MGAAFSRMQGGDPWLGAAGSLIGYLANQDRQNRKKASESKKQNTLQQVNDGFGYSGPLEAGAGALQLGMRDYRQALSVEQRIGTFGKFRVAYSRVGFVRNGLGNIGYAGAALNTYVYYNDFSSGNISGGKFAYRTVGTGASIGMGIFATGSLGGPTGSLVGAGVGSMFWAGEQIYNMVQQMEVNIHNFGSQLNYQFTGR